MLIHNLFYNPTDLFDQEKHLKFESDFGKNTWIWSRLVVYYSFLNFANHINFMKKSSEQTRARKI